MVKESWSDDKKRGNEIRARDAQICIHQTFRKVQNLPQFVPALVQESFPNGQRFCRLTMVNGDVYIGLTKDIEKLLHRLVTKKVEKRLNIVIEEF
jgi:hypothetical protein